MASSVNKGMAFKHLPRDLYDPLPSDSELFQAVEDTDTRSKTTTNTSENGEGEAVETPEKTTAEKTEEKHWSENGDMAIPF